jgi:RES domain-containing protein
MVKANSAYPDYDAIARRLSTVAARAAGIVRVLFRATEPTYATEHDLLTGKGSQMNGGRWNPPSSFATIYTAFTEVTLIAESKAHFVYYGSLLSR